MQINEQFWGSESQSQVWVPDVTITNYDILNAFNQTGGSAWTLPLNDELDTSICPWAINKDADILKLTYPVSHRIGTDGYNWAEPKFYPVHDYESEISGIPVYFAVPGYTGGGANSFNWSARNGNDVIQIQNALFRNMIYPVRNFDYSKLCVSVCILYTDSATTTDNVDPGTFDYYFTSGQESWRATHPIAGIGFQIYGRGWDSDYPNAWQPTHPTSGQQMLINTMGRKKPCEIAPSDTTVGYNVDYKDDFMTLVNGNLLNGLAIGAWANNYGGNGWTVISPDGSTWAQSYEQGAAAELSASESNRPIPKVPMLEGEENTHWRIYSNWAGTREVYFKTILDASTFADEEELKAYILRQAAYLGMWIYTNGTPQGDPGSDEHWYLGEIGSNGVTTGRYKQGSSTSELDNSTWESPWDSSGWNGRQPEPGPTPVSSGRILFTGDNPPTTTREIVRIKIN